MADRRQEQIAELERRVPCVGCGHPTLPIGTHDCLKQEPLRGIREAMEGFKQLGVSAERAVAAMREMTGTLARVGQHVGVTVPHPDDPSYSERLDEITRLVGGMKARAIAGAPIQAGFASGAVASSGAGLGPQGFKQRSAGLPSQPMRGSP